MTTSDQWIEQGLTTVAGTYGRYPLVAVRGEGCWLTDNDGKRYLDFLAGVAVNNLGHCHPAVVDAIREQAGTLIHCSNFYHIPAQIELSRLLCKHSFGNRVFFCNSGAEANEAALKLARKWSSDNFSPQRHEIISTIASFHGRTLATVSATGQEKVQAGFAPLLPGFKHVAFGDIEALHQAVGPNTCAVLLEPIQGEGGIRIPPSGYFKAVRELCNERRLLLIVDEIQTGLGRTGSLFAYQQEEIEPDVMTLAKALGGGVPIGAMIARAPYSEVLGSGTHGSTFGGNPLATAAAVAAFNELNRPQLLQHCNAVGAFFIEHLEQLQERHLVIQSVRGRGLMIGVELSCEGAPIVNKALERGLLINCTAGNVLRFVPPLIISRTEIMQAIDILDAILSEHSAGATTA
ncbi:MAG: acetylornithine transaminase [Desulfuromonadales bacterium]|nr:acetylornithine transaminase [Desulfuromonadales bacterium]